MSVTGDGSTVPMLLALISGVLKFKLPEYYDLRDDQTNSTFEDIVSDTSWKCSNTFHAMWTFPGFDDSLWSAATVLSE